MANEYRVATVAAEVLDNPTAGARIAQVGVETLRDAATAAAQLATVAAEVLRSAASSPTQATVGVVAAEVLRSVTDAAFRRRPLFIF